MTRRTFSGENAKILRGGGREGRRHDLAAADGLWAADWSFSYRVVAAGWDGVGVLMRSAGPCFDHHTVRV